MNGFYIEKKKIDRCTSLIKQSTFLKDDVLSTVRRPRLPLHFESLENQVNFFCIRVLLNVGSEYDQMLKNSSTDKRGWEDVMLCGLMSMHISGKKLDGEFLRQANAFNINQYFQIPNAEVEKEIAGGIFKLCDGPLKPFLNLLVHIMNQAGKRLAILDQSSLGNAVIDILDDELITAQMFVKRLSDAFPQDGGFNDEVLGVKLQTKAISLVHDIYDALSEQKEHEILYKRLTTDIESLGPEIDAKLMSSLNFAELYTKKNEEFILPNMNSRDGKDSLDISQLRLQSLKIIERLKSECCLSAREIVDILIYHYLSSKRSN